MLILSATDIFRAITMREAIEAVREAFLQVSQGRIIAPARTHLDIPAHRGTGLVMPCYFPGKERIGVKIINLYEGNVRQGLPHSYAVMLVFDATNGRPMALLEASSLTAMRTGAASGVATALLARKDARVAAIFGAGPQGKKQLEAVNEVRPIERAFIFDVDCKRSEAMAMEMSSRLGVEVIVARTPEEAVGEADIVCTATTSRIPVFPDTAVKAGTHINAIGSYKPDVREIPSATVARARIFVDHREAALEEAGDLVIPLGEGLIGKQAIIAEIGEVAAGRKPGRISDEDITFFKSVGLAAQDIAVASLVLEAAERLSLGQRFALE